MQIVSRRDIAPEAVHAVLKRHMLADGMKLVLDLERSKGVYLFDSLSSRSLVDFFGFFASNALGMNHAKLLGDEAFLTRLKEAALNKVTNSDVYTPHMARFVDTFARVAIPAHLHYAFFVSGGALAVENALKTAFDWKVRKNFAKGHRREVGSKVLHFDQAFHGRTGYTLSLTNTADPRKIAHFPKFDWPRVSNPKIVFPVSDANREDLRRREDLSIEQAKQVFRSNPDDVACAIIEPIQGEGGDNHFRREFLQRLKDLCHENDTLLVFDEVQSGVGISGRFWSHEAIGVEPDIIAFGKKTQVCGILASRKLDEVQDHVFQVGSRINSTWGGNLVDMVRFDKILEVIEEDDLVGNSATVGEHLRGKLAELAADYQVVSNVRGRGLMCAFDVDTVELRDRIRARAFTLGLILLGCGISSLRFRPPLTITTGEIDEGIGLMREAMDDVLAGRDRS